MANFARRMLVALWEETFHPANSLGMTREQMPQIRSFDVSDFLIFLAQHGVNGTNEVVQASALKPTQREINMEKSRTFDPLKVGDKRMLVSRDSYIMDGHHRWMHAVLNKRALPIIRLSADIRTILALAKQFPKTTYVGLDHYHR